MKDKQVSHFKKMMKRMDKIAKEVDKWPVWKRNVRVPHYRHSGSALASATVKDSLHVGEGKR